MAIKKVTKLLDWLVSSLFIIPVVLAADIGKIDIGGSVSRVWELVADLFPDVILSSLPQDQYFGWLRLLSTAVIGVAVFGFFHWLFESKLNMDRKKAMFFALLVPLVPMFILYWNFTGFLVALPVPLMGCLAIAYMFLIRWIFQEFDETWLKVWLSFFAFLISTLVIIPFMIGGFASIPSSEIPPRVDLQIYNDVLNIGLGVSALFMIIFGLWGVLAVVLGWFGHDIGSATRSAGSWLKGVNDAQRAKARRRGEELRRKKDFIDEFKEAKALNQIGSRLKKQEKLVNTETRLVRKLANLKQQEKQAFNAIIQEPNAARNVYQRSIELLEKITSGNNTPANINEFRKSNQILIRLVNQLANNITELDEILERQFEAYKGLAHFDMAHYQKVQQNAEDGRRVIVRVKALESRMKREFNLEGDTELQKFLQDLQQEDQKLESFLNAISGNDKEVFNYVRRDIHDIEVKREMLKDIRKKAQATAEYMHNQIAAGEEEAMFNQVARNIQYIEDRFDTMNRLLTQRNADLARVRDVMKKIRELNERLQRIDNIMEITLRRITRLKNKQYNFFQRRGAF